jgi:hypothetical protein
MQIDLTDPPKDPIERLVWLSGARDAFDQIVTPMWQRAYFEARQTGRLDAALDLNLHSRKKIMQFTRAENERTGRMWRWNDGRG